MRLGVNFCHDERQPIGFNRDAVLALRPPIVRFVVTAEHVGDLIAWIRHAEANRLEVLWTIPELLSLPTARTVARIIAAHGQAVTAGVEIGFAPWAFNRGPEEFRMWAEQVGTILNQAGGPGFSRTRPILLGLGFDGSREATAWFREFLRITRVGVTPRAYCHGVAVHATAPGRRFRQLLFRGMQATVMDAWRLPIAFTRVGWQLHQPLLGWTLVREALRAAWLREPGGEVLTLEMRRRWLLEAYEAAEQLGAITFVLEPDLVLLSEGVNRWPLYDTQTGRADTVWHRLQWRAARAIAPPAHV